MSHYPPAGGGSGWPPAAPGGWPPSQQSNYPTINNTQSSYPSIPPAGPQYGQSTPQYGQPPQHSYSSYHPAAGPASQPYHSQPSHHSSHNQPYYPSSHAPSGYPTGHAPHGAAPGGHVLSTGHGVASGGPLRPVLGSQYCAQQERVFLLREKVLSWSGDDFEVMDAVSGQKVYKLDSSAVSIRDHRVLKDCFTLKPVAQMKKKIFSRSNTWIVCQGASEHAVATIKKRQGGLPTADIFLAHNTSAHFSAPRPDYTITGDFRAKNMWIHHNGQPCGEVSRKVNTWKKAVGADSYALRVFPGFDYAFMLCLVLTVDELYND